MPSLSAIYDAATRTDSPLRIPVGADAEVLAAGRNKMTRGRVGVALLRAG